MHKYGKIIFILLSFMLFMFSCGNNGTSTKNDTTEKFDTVETADTNVDLKSDGKVENDAVIETEIKEIAQKDISETNDDLITNDELIKDITDESDSSSLCEPNVPLCLDKEGFPDLSLCPDPKTDYDCVDGCCIKKFKCKTNQECEDKKDDMEDCVNGPFHCHCNTDTGKCFSWYCTTTDDCKKAGYDNTNCINGSCQTVNSTDFQAEIMNGNFVIAQDENIKPVVVAYSISNPDMYKTDIDYELVAEQDNGIISITDTSIKGGSKYGIATLTAKLKNGGDASVSQPVKILNLIPAQEGKLRIYVYDQAKLDPITDAKVVVTETATDNVIFYGTSDNGMVEIDYPSNTPFNIHVFHKDYQYLSIVGTDENTLAIPMFRYFYAKLDVEQDMSLVPEKQDIIGGDFITGAPDYSNYDKFGEFEVGLTNFSFSQAIFDFNLKLIIGPDVKAYFDPNAPTMFPNDTQQELPGGLTFAFEQPVISKYYLADTGGNKTLWSISGRISINDLTTQMGNIVDAVKGDNFDFGGLVSTLFPLFRNFYSGIDRNVMLKDSPQYPPKSVNVVIKYPMAHSIKLDVPSLPTLMSDNQWLDMVICMTGALMPNGKFIPLGINAMSDKINKNDQADGIIDGIPETPDQADPLNMPFAPMHTGIGTEFADYYLITTAFSLNINGSGSKPEAASGMIRKLSDYSKFKGGEIKLGSYLPIPDSSQFNKDTGEFTIQDDLNVNFYRIILKDNKERSWYIYLAPETKKFTIPDISTYNAELSSFKINANNDIVNGIVLSPEFNFKGLIAPGNGYINTLLKHVTDTTYINLKN